MKYTCFILKLLLSFFLFLMTASGKAQQSRVDSVIQLLRESSSKKNPFDTSLLETANNLITQTQLTDTAIRLLENAASKSKAGSNLYFRYSVRLAILVNLTGADKYNAIAYGKYQFDQLEKSSNPQAVIIKSTFLKQLRIPYRNSDKLEEGFKFFTEKLKAYKLKNDSIGLVNCYYVLGGFYRTSGLLDQAIYNIKKSLRYMNPSVQKDNGYSHIISSVAFVHPSGQLTWSNNNGVIGQYLLIKGDYKDAVRYSRIACNYFTKQSNGVGISAFLSQLALAKILAGEFDSVSNFLDMAAKDAAAIKQFDFLAYSVQVRALYKIKTGDLPEAEKLLQRCWQIIRASKLPVNPKAGTLNPDYYRAMIRMQQNRFGDAILLLKNDIVWLDRNRLDILRDYKLLGGLYEKVGNVAAAKEAYKTFISLQDSLLADQQKYSSVNFETEQEMDEKELSITKLQSENKISSLSRNFTIGIAVLLLLLAAAIYYRYKSKQADNKVLERTLGDLKATQSQLIQSEKMASLGELTAGIAHEIQNPLNFVNNFSEINKEIINELQTELQAGNTEEAIAISTDIKSNSEKINHHGKRADAIVKGMLQHSRTNTGKKELTDINALADEYLRLSYHGLRAKDKGFNAAIQTHFDDSIGKINVVPQEVGRVLLNLFNNAFYAVHEKKKNTHDAYEPTVSVSTKKLANKIEISVKDNGMGISKSLQDKIFQPFFTTKPTGQGTGLGLSLSYDIIKAHGGELHIKSDEGHYAEFIVHLPLAG